MDRNWKEGSGNSNRLRCKSSSGRSTYYEQDYDDFRSRQFPSTFGRRMDVGRSLNDRNWNPDHYQSGSFVRQSYDRRECYQYEDRDNRQTSSNYNRQTSSSYNRWSNNGDQGSFFRQRERGTASQYCRQNGPSTDATLYPAEMDSFTKVLGVRQSNILEAFEFILKLNQRPLFTDKPSIHYPPPISEAFVNKEIFLHCANMTLLRNSLNNLNKKYFSLLLKAT